MAKVLKKMLNKLQMLHNKEWYPALLVFPVFQSAVSHFTLKQKHTM